MSGSSRLKERLEDIKAENKHLNDLLNQALKEKELAEQKLEKIKEIVSDEVNLKFDITDKLKEIKDIIEGEI